MVTSRRNFIRGSAVAAISAGSLASARGAERSGGGKAVDRAELDKVLDAPVLKMELVKEPVVVESVELLRNGNTFLVRARSTTGIEAVTVPNSDRMANVYPLFLRQVVPVFLKQDARRLESLLWDVYRARDNYKYQGMALWIGVIAIEMAMLELLAKAASRPVADFFGGAIRRDIPIYVASGTRGNTPEAVVENLKRLVAGSGAKALKFRLGGRMSKNVDSLPGRSEALIPLVRKAFGDSMTLYADANSSYDVANSIRIGRIMEEHNYGFFEEPVEFDDLWGTKE